MNTTAEGTTSHNLMKGMASAPDPGAVTIRVSFVSLKIV
ncbi:Uncharacterised protein [Chlamydia trachomatis]|nr:Uncharacterised protein [Chlamydia trachomatis]